jgi:WD40 repeat protein
MRRLQVIKLYDVETLQLALCLVAHTGVVMRCMHMEGTDYLVSSGTDGCLIFWGAYTATPRQIIPCDAVFTSLVWDITDRVLYAGSSSGAVYAFHVPEADGDRVEIAEGARLQAHADLITDMIVIVDLALLVTASLDSRILVWNVAALNAADPRDLAAQVEPRRVLLGHARGVNSLAYVTSQRYLISAGYESSCNVWNPMIEEPLFTMVGHQSMIAGLKIVVGSNRIVTSDIDGVCKVWDLRNFNCVQTVKDDRIFPGSVASVAYVSRLDRIVLAGFTPKDRKVGRMFALDYERPAQPDMADETAIVEAIHSAVNGTIITASARIVRIWDAKTGLLTQTYPNITEETITAMCLDGRERRIIIGDESGTIGIYNILNGTLIKKLQDHSADICALDYCASTRCILAASWAGRVTIHLDLPDKTMLLRRIDGHGSDITCLTYSLDLGLVGTACMSGEMRMWEFQDVKMRCSFEAHTCEVTLLAFLEEYRCFISGDFLGNMIVWTLSPWREQHTPVVRVEYTVVVGPDGAVRDSPTHAALHAASHTLFVAGSKGVVNAYDTSALLEALVGWQGVDDSGRQPGPLIPALPTRQLLRHPREGRSFVPDPRANRPVSTALLAASGDVTHDIGQHLRFRRDKTGAPQQPRLPATVVRQRFGFVAHTDALTSLRIVREAPGAIAPQTQGEGDAGEAAGAAGAAASGDAADQAAGAEREGGACLLTASSDQTVRLWKLDGAPLGSLQQGATSQTWLWLGASS